MKVNDTPTGKEIILSKAFDNRAKVLNVFYFIVFTLLGISVLRYINFRYEFNIGLIIFIAGFMVVYLLAGYRFINKAVQAEKILIDKTTLTHSKTGFLNKVSHQYTVQAISNFRHLEKPAMAKHQLAGESFDYLGFETQQQVINEMHGDKRLAFDYKGNTVTFGENVYSWDYDTLKEVLQEATGTDFSAINEWDKTFNLAE